MRTLETDEDRLPCGTSENDKDVKPDLNKHLSTSVLHSMAVVKVINVLARGLLGHLVTTQS